VFVGDGRKALFLHNAGDEKFPNLKTERVFVDENPPTHEQGSDRPVAHSSAPVPMSVAAWETPTGMTSRSTASLSGSPRRWNGRA
jgi:protein required for attachment to host cells